MAGPSSSTSPETHEAAFEAFGVRIAIGTNDPRVSSRLPELLPPCSRPCAPGEVTQHFSVATEDGATFTVRHDVRDGTAAGRSDAAADLASHIDLELALGLLDTQVHGCLALHAPEHVFIGAGAVEQRGRAILLPGPALSGKTTLVRALVSAGCAYYSDQYAVLDASGRIHAYPRPLSPAAAYGPEPTVEEPIPVGAVVATSYLPGAAWRPARLSRGEAVLALMTHAAPAQHRTGQVMGAISRAVENADVLLAGDRGEADVVAASLMDGGL